MDGVITLDFLLTYILSSYYLSSSFENVNLGLYSSDMTIKKNRNKKICVMRAVFQDINF